jgi:Flp pilus assembly protein TadG
MIKIVRSWRADVAGAAMAEFVLIFPILMVMLMGVYELSRAISINQRSIAASQIIADLIARNVVVDDAIVDDAIRAGELALEPYSLEGMGVDIVSVQYDENDEPQELWRVTRDMDEDEDAVENSSGLGVDGDGTLIVTVQYLYQPVFDTILDEAVTMRETTYARGRRTSVVSYEP